MLFQVNYTLELKKLSPSRQGQSISGKIISHSSCLVPTGTKFIVPEWMTFGFIMLKFKLIF